MINHEVRLDNGKQTKVQRQDYKYKINLLRKMVYKNLIMGFWLRLGQKSRERERVVPGRLTSSNYGDRNLCRNSLKFL